MLGNKKVLVHGCKEKQPLLIASRRLWEIADNHGWECIIKSHQNKTKQTTLPVSGVSPSPSLSEASPLKECATVISELLFWVTGRQAGWSGSTFTRENWHLSAWWAFTVKNSRDFSDSHWRKGTIIIHLQQPNDCCIHARRPRHCVVSIATRVSVTP